MPAPHAFYSKMLAERTASRNVFVLFYFILFYFRTHIIVSTWHPPSAALAQVHTVRMQSRLLLLHPAPGALH